MEQVAKRKEDLRSSQQRRRDKVKQAIAALPPQQQQAVIEENRRKEREKKRNQRKKNMRFPSLLSRPFTSSANNGKGQNIDPNIQPPINVQGYENDETPKSVPYNVARPPNKDPNDEDEFYDAEDGVTQPPRKSLLHRPTATHWITRKVPPRGTPCLTTKVPLLLEMPILAGKP